MLNLIAPAPTWLAISEVGAETFHRQVTIARQLLPAPLRFSLTPHDLPGYTDARLFLTEDRQSGFGVRADGELINVFSFTRGRGDHLVAAAVERGACHLDCYDGYLPKLYRRHGFEEARRIPWDDQYAPTGWDQARWGRPDVVFMAR